MSDILEVNPDGMRAVISRMRSGAGAFGHTVGSLTYSSRLLVDEQWSGEASNAYRGRQTGWNKSMDAHHADLVEYVALLGRIVGRYEAAEGKVIALCGT